MVSIVLQISYTSVRDAFAFGISDTVIALETTWRKSSLETPASDLHLPSVLSYCPPALTTASKCKDRIFVHRWELETGWGGLCTAIQRPGIKSGS